MGWRTKAAKLKADEICLVADGDNTEKAKDDALKNLNMDGRRSGMGQIKNLGICQRRGANEKNVANRRAHAYTGPVPLYILQ
jgi:hypothetical protein